ncbi:MAG: glycosyltransferase family 2 protein [Clostridia bacterium]|nr:glycosyltransferase family 2 protein [Clostridia bacterium]
MHTSDHTPFFSIITPVYNRKQCVQNAIDSILKQDFSDWEYLIVDDGSTDGTAEVIDQATAKDSRINALHLPYNQGVSAARNRGIQTAKGKYLLFLDSDDEFKNGAFSFLVHALTEHPAVDTVVFSIDRFDNSVDTAVTDTQKNYQLLNYSAIRFPFLAGMLGTCPLEKKHIYRPIVWNKCIRRTVFSENSILFDVQKVTWEDREVCIKVLDGCQQILTTDIAMIMDRTSEVGDHLSMKYYPDGAKNVLSQYKWALQKFGSEFDFHSDYAVNWIYQNIQLWLERIMAKDKNRRLLMQEILTDADFINIVTSRTPDGFFQKAVCRALSKKKYRRAYRIYWLQNLLNRGRCY